ncbi:lysin A, glycosyl hydrolase domain [Gordonia phage Neobush]|uniref:Lysin A, glycosyl hydrolase domain n=8 Tax=Nymphadoravirus TaxID=2169636 RepID=A0A4D6T608_9CAUD|nr:endolysin [Gordonia phage Kita]YP_010653132.1 endolysin [Gordonia phage Maridalia]QCG77441.1 lysin A, glycosyl hydrolase domain [Gordonia phage Antonio]QCW22426.1 lysin A, glycosyl hydrolase domain [Gordonia phage Tayonia]QDF16503.1 lysin A, glycosyl hydrolase domain [Gordonia phage Zameen]QDH48848.1 lysin A, glycosyl hydrolase domain [Gordonia phage Suscepit]QUE26129.1 lysin A, glycosyl hydrolase domain [Gordonia phage Trumpet]QUE26307.1 lysin A, glycosyl hydrolase domain [Gordonia phage
MGTYWADVSQFQRAVTDEYPHRVFSFRTNSGDQRDKNAAANLDWALAALDRGDLDIVIPYYFFRPGAANCDLWRQVVTRGGKIDPRIVCMVDVESGNGSSQGSIPIRDHSAEINDEIARVRGWLGGSRVIGYYNLKADPALWRSRGNVPLVVPHYGVRPGESYAYPNRFAHQYSDRVPCAPFGPCDANYTELSIPQLKTLFGIGGTTMATDVDKINEFTRAFNAAIGSDTKDVREQLVGARDLVYKTVDGKKVVDIEKSFPGWPQLGNRTVVDALAAIGAALGIPGFYDPLGVVKNPTDSKEN